MTHTSLNSAPTAELEELLNSFDPAVRKQALDQLARRLESGAISVSPTKNEVNLHVHTFFSFNANQWSPSRIAWEAKKHGLAVAGIVDFDVLDGMEEFLSAGDVLRLPATAALETRVFIREYAEHVMSSPNEPGIAYFMGTGCYTMPEPGTRAAATLQTMREMARRRNLEVMNRVNAYLRDVQIDYETDVLPLTPSGNATERHMLAAYDRKSREVFPDPADLAAFWAKSLEITADDAASLLKDTPGFHEKMRAKLMKYGSVGYAAPTADTFPSVEEVIEMVLGMNALPALAWLDGTNSGESDMPALLGLLAEKGTLAMNIIPDRNWNITDPHEKQTKLDNLAKAVAAAREIGFPLCVGTEMNKLGLPFVDNFSAPELAPYIDDFISGAFFFWGHTFLARAGGIGAVSTWADHNFGADRAARNRFYEQVGRAAVPQLSTAKLGGVDLPTMSPAEILNALR